MGTGVRELAELRKGDERKALLAAVLRRRTAVATQWIAQRLAMGHPGSVSRQVGIVKRDRKLVKKLNEHEQNVSLRGLVPETYSPSRKSCAAFSASAVTSFTSCTKPPPIPDDEPNLTWFNQPRKPLEPGPDWLDQSPAWMPHEVPLSDGRTLVLEYT